MQTTAGSPSPLPQLLASASYDDTVKLYREEEDDWVCCATLEGHESTVWSLAFDPSGQRLASCSDDRTVRIWRQYLPGNEQGEGPVVELKGRLLHLEVCHLIGHIHGLWQTQVKSNVPQKGCRWCWDKGGRRCRMAILSKSERMGRILTQ